MIVGLKYQGHVYLAVDNQNSNLIGLSKKDLSNPNNLKLWSPREHTIIASNDESRAIDLLRYENLFDECIDTKTLQLFTADKIRDILKKYDKFKDKTLNGQYLFAYKDKLYNMDLQTLVTEYKYYRALGEASQAMISYLHKTKNSDMDPINRLKEGFKICGSYTHKMLFPIYVMNTKDQLIHIIFE